MGDSPEQIAEGLQRLLKAIEALGHDLAEHPFDRDHVRTRLGVFSAVLSGLCSRVLALGIKSQARKIEAHTSGLPAEWAKEIVRLTGGLIE
jgi:hypothetical protein